MSKSVEEVRRAAFEAATLNNISTRLNAGALSLRNTELSMPRLHGGPSTPPWTPWRSSCQRLSVTTTADALTMPRLMTAPLATAAPPSNKPGLGCACYEHIHRPSPTNNPYRPAASSPGRATHITRRPAISRQLRLTFFQPLLDSSSTKNLATL